MQKKKVVCILDEAHLPEKETIEEFRFLLNYKFDSMSPIPNWDIGTELASLSDTFWNEERLRNYTRMRKVDACTVVTALKILADNKCMG